MATDNVQATSQMFDAEEMARFQSEAYLGETGQACVQLYNAELIGRYRADLEYSIADNYQATVQLWDGEYYCRLQADLR